MPTWIKSNLVIAGIDNGTVRLTGEFNSEVKFPLSVIRLRNNKLEILKGAKAKSMKPPKIDKRDSHVTPLGGAAVKATTACSRTACIGLIMFCCDDWSVVGGCIGVSGC